VEFELMLRAHAAKSHDLERSPVAGTTTPEAIFFSLRPEAMGEKWKEPMPSMVKFGYWIRSI
jgi:hypothetical protein